MLFEIKVEVWLVCLADTGRVTECWSKRAWAERRARELQAIERDDDAHYIVVGPYTLDSNSP